MLSDDAVVGRILKVHAAPVGKPWMWTLPFGHHEDRSPTNGYAATREAAMASFAKSRQWEKWNLCRAQVSCRARSVSAQLNFVGANLRPDAVAPPHGRTLAAIHPSAARWASKKTLGFVFGRIAHWTADVGNSMIGLCCSAIWFLRYENPARVFDIKRAPTRQKIWRNGGPGLARARK